MLEYSLRLSPQNAYRNSASHIDEADTNRPDTDAAPHSTGLPPEDGMSFPGVVRTAGAREPGPTAADPGSERVHRRANGCAERGTMHRPGVEPGLWAWKAHVLPLDYRCERDDRPPRRVVVW